MSANVPKPISGLVSIPKGWQIVRLGDVANIAFSGVDKKHWSWWDLTETQIG